MTTTPALLRGTELHMDYRKWPDALHWQFRVLALGEDSFGRWYHLPPGTPLTRGDYQSVQKQHSVLLLPTTGSWTAFWSSDREQEFALYVDVTTPVRFSDGRATLVDLDLDVVRRWSGAVEVLDEDEFALHQQALAYPPDIIRSAEATSRWLVERVTERSEPFGDIGERWLQAVNGP